MQGLEYQEAGITRGTSLSLPSCCSIHLEMDLYRNVCFLYRVTGLCHSCYPWLRWRSWEPEGVIWPREGESESFIYMCVSDYKINSEILGHFKPTDTTVLPEALLPSLHDSWKLFAFNLFLPFRFQTLTLMPSCSSHLHLSCHWIPIGLYWLCPKGSLKAPLPARVSAHFFHSVFVVYVVKNCPRALVR